MQLLLKRLYYITLHPIIFSSESREPHAVITPSKYQKINLALKNDIGDIAQRNKLEYDKEVLRLEKIGKVFRSGKWITPKPKIGYLMKTVRETHPHLASFGNVHLEVQAAKQVVVRALKRKMDRETDPEDFSTDNPSKRFREIGGGEY